MDQYLDIGVIANTHGIKGELKIVPLTDNSERFSNLKSVLVDNKGNLKSYNIEYVKYFKDFVILKFKEIPDMTAAEKLKGLILKIERKDAVKLPKDSFFICDLIGCQVLEENNKNLGRVTNILKTGSNDVYVVEDENGKEILIPALKTVVKEISVENKKILVSLPEGLLDDEV
jgi:16S rRNA processing protein RimM